MPEQELYMQRAIELARKGWPEVSPNPMVGCVIVFKGEIVSEGHHEKFGGPHAEVNAIRALPAHISPSECEVYVTLEPCSHQGKTPPCADLIISKGFKKVIIATADPNPLVNGKGIARLKNAGIEVLQGILENEARYLNRRFFTFHEKKRPFITIKWAETSDGFISRLPLPENRLENRISGEKALQFAHQLRAENMAILVGKNTVLADDPELSTRLVAGNNPVRVILDSNLRVPLKARVFNNKAKTLIFNFLKEETGGSVTYYKLNKGDSLPEQVLKKLYELGIQSLLIEGGTQVIQSFLAKGLYDQVYRIQNPALSFGNGIPAPTFDFGNIQSKNLDKDFLQHYEAPFGKGKP